MKKIVPFSLALLFVLMLFIACDPINNDPLHAELRLVPLTTGDLSKAINGEDGNLYLPLSELQPIMAKAAVSDIYFGEVKATKTLQYVLMNVGNTDVYDITFEAGDLTIYPSNIALVPTPDEGGDLIALPIISMTKEHVIPIDGVGSLLDMSTGAFNDMVSLSYNYNIVDTASVDSFDVTDEYTVEGTKMGALIDIQVSGQHLQDALQGSLERYDLYGFIDPFFNLSVSSDILDTMIVYNNGNVPLPLRIINPYIYRNGGSAVLDTILLAGANIDISGIIRGEQYFEGDPDINHGNIIFFGSDRNQSFIFEILGTLCIDGEEGLLFNESASY